MSETARPLFIAAVEGEAAYVPEGAEVIVCGIGTVAAATALTKRLVEGPRPSRVINVGTAGSLKDGQSGVFEINGVIKHDFEYAKIEEITGLPQKRWLHLPTSGKLPEAYLATGDSFINDGFKRESLREVAELCDMEGWAVVYVCQQFGVDVTLLKQVSDDADETATVSWSQAIDKGAWELGDALRELGF